MSAPISPDGFVPPPYPHDRLVTMRRLAEALPGGLIDLSIGNPVDPVPDVVVRALRDTASNGNGYPYTIGSPEFRAAASGWMHRRFDINIPDNDVLACVGTKELVASLPRLLHLRNPERDTVLYPAVSYPTYAMGAQLAGLRAVPVPMDDAWQLDLVRISDSDAERSLVLWLNYPSNPTGAVADTDRVQKTINWARQRGILVASDECYCEFTCDENGKPADPISALSQGSDGVLAVHSLSKRSNMAGYRAGFVAGDSELVHYLGEVRKHAGMMVASPVQAAAVAALNDDAHVEEQRNRYIARRLLMLDAFEEFGLAHDGGPLAFYLWLRDANGTDDGWEIAANLAEAGILVTPGDIYGVLGADHIRVSLAASDKDLASAVERIAAVHDRR